MLSTDELVDLHDRVLRGDGGPDKLGLVALVTNLCVKVDILDRTVRAMELELAKAKGWVIGASAVGAGSGAVITFLIEHFVMGGKH